MGKQFFLISLESIYGPFHSITLIDSTDILIILNLFTYEET